MASSGSTKVQVTSYNSLSFEWEITSQSAANNNSTVRWYLFLDSSTYGAISSSANKSWTVAVNGNNYSGTNKINTIANSRLTLAAGTTTIPHNSDGTKTFYYSFTQQFDMSFGGAWYGTATGSGSGALDAIPRGATATGASNFYDTQYPILYYSNPAGTAVTSLQACISTTNTGVADLVAYRDIDKSGSSYKFVDITLAEKEAMRKATTTAKSRDVYYVIKTVIGGEAVYSSIKKTLTILDAAPYIDPVVIDNNSHATSLTGSDQIIIRGYNALYYDFNSSVKKHATIKRQSVTCGAQTSTTETGYFNNVIDNEFAFELVDSRGYKVTKTITLNMIPYIPVTCSVDGEMKVSAASSSQAELEFTISGNYFNGSFGAQNNSLALTYNIYNRKNGSLVERKTVAPTQAQINDNYYSVTLVKTGLDYNSSYTVEVSAGDAIGSATASSKLFDAIPIFDWDNTGFNFNVPVSINNTPIADYVIETGQTAMGSNGTWYWRKWVSGRSECYGVRNYGNMAVSTAWGSLYRSEAFSQALPFGLFAQAPEYIDIRLCLGNYGGWIITHESDSPSSTYTGAFAVVRPASATISQAYISFNVIGRWK